jgi:two-component system OmpR family response regulator
MRVLIVEDKVKLAGQLWRALRGEGMAADVAVNGEDALWMAQATRYDAVVLDVMLPGIDGLQTVQRLRAEADWVPVLMLTARGSLEDRVAGLHRGADDYMTKPFELVELVARLRALVRRGALERAAVLEVGELRLDPAGRRVWRDRHEIELAEKPFALLETFMRQPGVTLTRFALLESAWDHAYESRSNVIDQHVRALRDRIDRPFGVESIETVRGRGYRLREDGGR